MQYLFIIIFKSRTVLFSGYLARKHARVGEPAAHVTNAWPGCSPSDSWSTPTWCATALLYKHLSAWSNLHNQLKRRRGELGQLPMNVAVLRSQNCFREQMRQQDHPCRPLPPPGRPDCKKKSKKQPSPPRKRGGKPPPRPPLQAKSKANPKVSQPEEMGLARPRRFLDMEEVRILKRGEELIPQTVPPLAPSATVPIELGFLDFSGLYSGTGFFFSPSPSSLPFPSSLLKKPAFLEDRWTQIL